MQTHNKYLSEQIKHKTMMKKEGRKAHYKKDVEGHSITNFLKKYTLLFLAAIVVVASFAYWFYNLDYGGKENKSTATLSPPLYAGEVSIEPQDDESVRVIFEVTNNGDGTIILKSASIEELSNGKCGPLTSIRIVLKPGEKTPLAFSCSKEVDGSTGRLSVQYTIDDGDLTYYSGGSITLILPSANVPQIGESAGQIGGGAGQSSGGGGGSGGGTSVPSVGYEPPENPGIIPTVGTPDLVPPFFLNINEDPNQNGFSVNDNTPIIIFSTVGDTCRWSPLDSAYNVMPAGNNCQVNSISAIGSCTISLVLPDGPNTLHISCSDSGSFNGPANNLDISGEVDSNSPSISVNPPSGTNFQSGTSSVTVTVTTNEPASCTAGGSTCSGNGAQTHPCNINLNTGSNSITISCADDTAFDPNSASVEVNYNVAISSGGGGAPAPVQASPDILPEGGGSIPAGGGTTGGTAGNDEEGGLPPASVIRDTESTDTLFEAVVNSIKGFFKRMFGVERFE